MATLHDAPPLGASSPQTRRIARFRPLFDDAPMTHFCAQPIESVEMTHESSKVRTCAHVRIRAHGESFRASLRHLNTIKHLYPKSASPVRHQPMAEPMVTAKNGVLRR